MGKIELQNHVEHAGISRRADMLATGSYISYFIFRMWFCVEREKAICNVMDMISVGRDSGMLWVYPSTK